MQLSIRPSNDAPVSFNLYNDLAACARRSLKPQGALYNQSPQSHLFKALPDFAWREAIRHYFIERLKGRHKLPPWSDDIIETILRRSEERRLTESVLPPDCGPTSTELDEAKAIINEFGAAFLPLIDQTGVCVKRARLIPAYKFPFAWRKVAANWCEIEDCVDIITHTQFNDPDLKKDELRHIIRAALPRKLPSRFEIIVVYKAQRRPLPDSSGTADNALNSDWEIDEWCLHTLAYLRGHDAPQIPVIAGMVIYLNELCPTFDALGTFISEMEQDTTDIVPPEGGYVEKGLSGWNKIPPDIRSRANQPYLPFDFRLKRAVRIFDIAPGTIKKALKTVDDIVICLAIQRCRQINSVGDA